jgi:hypothetical protein
MRIKASCPKEKAGGANSDRALSVVLLAAALLLPAVAMASEPAGTYVVPTQVDITSVSGKATEVIIHGAFFQLTGANPGAYGDPLCGRMYFACASGQEAICAMQWQELQLDVGATGLCFGFGAFDLVPAATLRSEAGPLGAPDVWDMGMGIQQGSYVDGKCQPARALACPAPNGAGGRGGSAGGGGGRGGMGAGGMGAGGTGNGGNVGGKADSGGVGGVGGTAASGGVNATGGANATGGGGTSASGGANATGGANTTGGAGANATGGTGASATGGGGANTTGGAGASAMGGANAMGGGGTSGTRVKDGSGCRVASGDSDVSAGLGAFIFLGLALHSVRRAIRRRRG